MRRLFGRPIELLCFDLDDTLLDTEAGAPSRFEAAVRALRSMRPDLDGATIARAVERGLRTHPTEGRVANFIADVGVTDSADVAELRTAYFAAMADVADAITGAQEALTALADHFRLAIVTNGPSEQQRRKLDRSGLGAQVNWIVISDEVGVEKPHRAIFEHVRGLTGIEAARTAHVGDSLLTDVAGANAAGLMSIWVRNSLVRATPDRPELTPHATIGHVRELLTRD